MALLRVMTEAAGEGVRGLDGLEFLALRLLISRPASLPSDAGPHIICTDRNPFNASRMTDRSPAVNKHVTFKEQPLGSPRLTNGACY